MQEVLDKYLGINQDNDDNDVNVNADDSEDKDNDDKVLFGTLDQRK